MSEWPTGRMPALVVEPGRIEQVEVDVPAAQSGHVLVEVSYLGICGTDVELLHDRSYYIDRGLASYPVRFGHEWTGIVVAVADDVVSVNPGDAVIGQTVITCGACPACQRGNRTGCENHLEVGLLGHDGAAAQYISMPASAVTRLPEGVSLRDAVLIEPGVTAMSGIWKTRLAFDDHVVVIGTGTLGLLAVAFALRITKNVDVVGVEEAGLELARRLGARRTLHPDELAENAYTVALEASGQPSSVALLGTVLQPGGRAALIGVVNRGVPDFIPALVTLKDISLFGVLHGLDHYGRVAGIIGDAFDADALIDRVLPWTEAAEAFRLLADRELVRPKIMLDLTTMRRS